MKRLLFRLAILILVPFGAAPAAAATPIKITDDIARQLTRVSDYLQDIKTLQSSFLQVSSNGEVAQGTITLLRPRRLRIDYDPPSPILIIANGSFLSYVDKDLKQIQHIPVEDTPAAFLVRESMSFQSPDITVSGFERAAGALRISVVQTRDPLAGQITLVFTDEPLVLRKWVVVDAQGIVTNFTLTDPQFGVPVSDKIFETGLITFE